MRKRGVRPVIQSLENRTLFSIPFLAGTTADLTLNPTHSAALVQSVTGPLFTGDFNNDGRSDVLFGARNGGDDSTTHYLGVMLANANGTLTDAGTIQIPTGQGGTSPYYTISAYGVGDFNSDGLPDVALVYRTINGSLDDYNLVIAMGRVDGTFTLKPALTFDSTSYVPSYDIEVPASMAIGKFVSNTTDDQIAVVVPHDVNTEAVDILNLDGLGQPSLRTQTFMQDLTGGDDQIVAGHFVSGTIPDVAIFDPIASKVVMMQNDGGANFTDQPTIAVAPPIFASGPDSVMVAGDFNGDGKTDLVIQEAANGSNSTNLYSYINNGNGGATALPVVVDGVNGQSATWITVGQFEESGKDEVATSYGIYRASGSGALLRTGIAAFPDSVDSHVAVGDFNEDFTPDLVASKFVGDGQSAIETQIGATSSSFQDITATLQDNSVKNAQNADINSTFELQVKSTTTGTPTGYADFYAEVFSSKTIVDLGEVPLVNGVATISPTNMPLGTSELVASYSGDATFAYTTQQLDAPLTYVGGNADGIFTPLQSAIINSTLPESVVAGKNVGKSVTVAIKNNGATAYNDKTTINIFAAADFIVTPTDPIVTTVTKTLKLAPNQTKNLVLKIKSFPANLSGVYHIFAETVENGFQTSITQPGAFVRIGPPLVVLQPSNILLPVNISHDGSETILVSISNDGNITSTGSSQVLLYGSSDTTVANGKLLVKKITGLHLPPGKKITFKIKANALETQLGFGSAYFVVEVINANGGTETASIPASQSID